MPFCFGFFLTSDVGRENVKNQKIKKLRSADVDFRSFFVVMRLSYSN